MVTVAADVHLLATACTAIHPMRFDGFHCTVHPGKHWTKPCREGIKARRPCPCGTRRKKARGSAKNLSGPSLFGQPGQDNADAARAACEAAITTTRNRNAPPAISSRRTSTAHPDTSLPIRVAADLLKRLLWSKHQESRGFMSRLTAAETASRYAKTAVIWFTKLPRFRAARLVSLANRRPRDGRRYSHRL